MFESYTERARKVLFFARYEASTSGSSQIETEHVLLGLLREDPMLPGYLSRLPALPGYLSHVPEVPEAIRREIEAIRPRQQEISTRVELPFSNETKVALLQADAERKALGESQTDCGHLVLGLLRVEESLAAQLLKKRGMDYESYQEAVRTESSERRVYSFPIAPSEKASRPALWFGTEEVHQTTAPSFGAAISRLTAVLKMAIAHVDTPSETYGRRRLKRKPWSRTEALGHLIDYATAHHQYFARALTEPKLFIASLPGDDWVPAQRYADCPWNDVLDLWVSLNSLLVHVLGVIPEEKVQMPCRVGIEEPIPFLRIVDQYVEHTEDLVGQITSKLE